MAPLRCAAKFDPFLSLDCAPTPSTLAQSKERKGSNFAILQPCIKVEEEEMVAADDEDAAWDSWGDPEEAEKVAAPPIDIATMPKPPSNIAVGAKKFVDADLSMMDIKARVFNINFLL